MVVFTCNHCGESLQKPKVEKHYQFVCRTIKNLTCVDCFKDFRNEEYNTHNKCITEEERYAAKGSLPNGIVKKGEVKQESWVEMIKSIIEKETQIPKSHKDILNTIAGFSNVPRKKQKFINFMKSTTGGRVPYKIIEDVWDIIEKHKNLQSTKGDESTNHKNGIENHKQTSQTNGNSHESNGRAMKSLLKKRKQVEDNNEDVSFKKIKHGIENGAAESNDKISKNEDDKFSFKENILKILEKHPSITISKLEKKFVKVYTNNFGGIDDLERISKKFNKKLKKLDNVTINSDKVLLTC